MMETVQRISLINLVTSVLLARKQEVARTIARMNRQKKIWPTLTSRISKHWQKWNAAVQEKK